VRAFLQGEEDVRPLLPAEPDRDRIASGIAALLEGTSASPEETFFVIRRFLTALASSLKE